MKQLYGILICLLFISVLNYAQPLSYRNGEKECRKNVFFYFDVTETVFGRGNPTPSVELSQALTTILSSKEILSEGDKFRLNTFDKTVTNVIKAIITDENRNTLFDKETFVLNHSDDNEYDVLFTKISNDIKTEDVFGKNSNYIFIFSDFVYDTKIISKGNILSEIKAKTRIAYENLLAEAENKNYRIFLIYGQSNAENDPYYYYLKPAIFDNYKKNNVTIVPAESGIVTDQTKFVEYVKTQVSIHISSNKEKEPVILNENTCDVLISLNNNSCIGEVKINDSNLKLSDVKVNGEVIISGNNVELLDSVGNPINSLIIPNGQKRFFIVRINNTKLSLQDAQKYRNKKYDEIQLLIELSDENTDTIKILSDTLQIGSPLFDVDKLWNIDMSFLGSGYNILRILLKPRNPTDKVNNNYMIKVTVPELMGCEELTDTFEITTDESEKIKPIELKMEYQNICSYNNKGEIKLKFEILQNGSILETYQQNSGQVPKEISFLTILIIPFIIVFFITILFFIIYRGIKNQVIQTNRKYLKIN